MTDASDDAGAHDRETSAGEGYGELLAVLDTLEQEALRKVEKGRVYDAENERVRIKWIRITKDVIAEKRKVMAERDLEELAERIEALEERENGAVGPGGVNA